DHVRAGDPGGVGGRVADRGLVEGARGRVEGGGSVGGWAAVPGVSSCCCGGGGGVAGACRDAVPGGAVEGEGELGGAGCWCEAGDFDGQVADGGRVDAVGGGGVDVAVGAALS